MGGVGRAQASDRVPSGRGRITWNGCGLIVADGHVEEVGGLLGRIGRDLIQGGIDVAKIPPSRRNRCQPPPAGARRARERLGCCRTQSEAPTAVTRGSEAGHSTLGYGISRGLLVGSLSELLVPPSPEDASTVMPRPLETKSDAIGSACVLPGPCSRE